jgi:molecular chaperone DnaK (HSP70)
VKKALEEAGLQASALDAVEWIGSAMRAIPLQEAVAKAVGRPLSSTMNAEESVAKGCSLACALVSPLIRLNKKYKLIDIQPTPITLSWKTLNDIDDNKESSIELFPRKQHFGKTKIVTITRKEAKPFELVANYSAPQDFPLTDVSGGNVINARVTSIPKEADENGNRDAEVRLKIRLDPSGTTQIVEAELMEKKEVEVEIPIVIDVPPVLLGLLINCVLLGNLGIPNDREM